MAVADAAEQAIVIAREAVGLAGQFLTHPLSAMLSDLAVYLRQPMPDAQRLRVRQAVQQGLLSCRYEAGPQRLPPGRHRRAASR
jgi:hypothetical protein